MRPAAKSTVAEDDNNVVDPVEAMLERTGCIQLHYKVQECIASTQDWRKCQSEVQEFRTCMAEYTKAKQKKQG